MKRAKTLLTFLLAAFSAFFVAPLCAAHANAPAPPGYFYIGVTNAGPDVKYADVLIKMSKSSESYTDWNSSNASVYGFSRSAPIIAYDQDGYRSVSFHGKNVRSIPNAAASGPGSIVELGDANTPISSITDSIRIALLDGSGNILKISDAVSVMPADGGTFPCKVEYDAGGAAPTVSFTNFYRGSFSAASLLAFLIRMAISISIEALIAVPFKIRPLRKIVAVNAITQILLFVFIESGQLNYTSAVIVGEIFVFAIEFLAYILLFKRISKARIALYTAVANAASLAAGLIFNHFHLLVG